jgi:hypothetical protein
VERKNIDWLGGGMVVFVDIDEASVLCVQPRIQRVAVEDPDPVRYLKGHLHPAKVMVLCAIGSPTETFDGKVGIWPIIEESEATRKSKHKVKGAIYAKNVTLDGPRYKSLWLDDVDGIGVTIRRKYPNAQRVVVQHDGASAHLGDANVHEIEQQLNRGGALPYIEIVTQPAMSPDVNTLDIGFWRVLKVCVRKLRSIAKYRAYKAKQLANEKKRPANDDDEGEEDVVLPKVRCGDKRLLQGVNETLARCVKCNDHVEGTPAIKCSSRGGWFHVECLRKAPPKKATNNVGVFWACDECFNAGCLASVPGRSDDACVVCGTRDACRNCVDRDVECEHWIQCESGEGFYHACCAGVDDDDLYVKNWVCRLCLETGKNVEREVEVAPDWPPAGQPAYKYVDIWYDTTDSVLGAVMKAWNMISGEKVKRLFETKAVMIREIIKARGGNNFKTPHWRNADDE